MAEASAALEMREGEERSLRCASAERRRRSGRDDRFWGVMQILGVMRVSGGNRRLGRARWVWLVRSGRLSFRGASV